MFNNNVRGQAFVEAIFIFPLMVMMIFSVIWFARILLTWQQLVSAARYGSDMIANTTLNASDVKKDIENYLTNKKIEGRRLDIEKIKEININIRDYNIADFNMYNLSNVSALIKSLSVPSSELSSVSIKYSYDLPKIMHCVGLTELNITANSFVLSGSGCKNNIHKKL